MLILDDIGGTAKISIQIWKTYQAVGIEESESVYLNLKFLVDTDPQHVEAILNLHMMLN